MRYRRGYHLRSSVKTETFRKMASLIKLFRTSVLVKFIFSGNTSPKIIFLADSNHIGIFASNIINFERCATCINRPNASGKRSKPQGIISRETIGVFSVRVAAEITVHSITNIHFCQPKYTKLGLVLLQDPNTNVSLLRIRYRSGFLSANVEIHVSCPADSHHGI